MTFAALAGGAYDAPPDPLVGWGGNTLSPFTTPRGLRRLSLCIYCLKCTKFGQLILRKIIKIVPAPDLDFKAKMHQIRFRCLGLMPLLFKLHEIWSVDSQENR